MAGAHAARLHDPVAHSHALGGFLAGAAVGLAAAVGTAVVIGAVVGAAAVEVGSAGLATPLVVGVAATAGEFGLNAVVGGKLMGLAEEAGEKLGGSSMGATSGQVADGAHNVLINGQPAARALDAESCHTGKIAQGSLTVGINGRAAARVGDKCTCGAVITQGAPNVLIGGPTGTFAGIQSEVPAWARWAVVVVSILPALGGLARAVGPALAEVEATGLSRALQTGVKALGRAMEERGGGGGEPAAAPDSAPEDTPAVGPPVQKLNYKPTSGVPLEGTPGQTTTVLGSYRMDTSHVVDEMGNVKSTDFGAKPGQLNVLNVPDDLYQNPDQFWNDYNKPWLQNAVDRGDPILMATSPDAVNPDGTSVLTSVDRDTGQVGPSGFGREFQYLQDKGYTYQDGKMSR